MVWKLKLFSLSDPLCKVINPKPLVRFRPFFFPLVVLPEDFKTDVIVVVEAPCVAPALTLEVGPVFKFSAKVTKFFLPSLDPCCFFSLTSDKSALQSLA